MPESRGVGAMMMSPRRGREAARDPGFEPAGRVISKTAVPDLETDRRDTGLLSRGSFS